MIIHVALPLHGSGCRVRKKGSTASSVSVASSTTNNLPKGKVTAPMSSSGPGPSASSNHATAAQIDKENQDRNSTCSDDSNYTEITEVKERPSTSTVVRMA